MKAHLLVVSSSPVTAPLCGWWDGCAVGSLTGTSWVAPPWEVGGGVSPGLPTSAPGQGGGASSPWVETCCWSCFGPVSLLISERWSISCHISKQGYHSHQQFQPSKCEFLNSEGTWEGEQGLPEAVMRLHHCLWWALKETKDVKRRRTLTPVCWDACERNDFSGPRLLHLPICRKVLNSLRYLVFFNFTKITFDVQTTCSLLQTCITWHPPPSPRDTWDYFRLEVLKIPTNTL